MDLVWIKLKSVDEIQNLLNPMNKILTQVVSGFLQDYLNIFKLNIKLWQIIAQEADDCPIVNLGSLDKARLLGDQKMIIVDKQDSHYVLLVNHKQNKVTVFLNPESNIKLGWIIRLIKNSICGKKGLH